MKAPTSAISRRTLFVTLLLLTLVQSWFALNWISKWGFFGGIVYWLKSAQLDPVYAAAVLDFISIIAIVGLWLLRDFKIRQGSKSPLFFLWAFFYLIYPSLGVLIYMLWMRPAVRDLTSVTS